MQFKKGNEHEFKRRSSLPLDPDPICFKGYLGQKEALRSVEGWQERLRSSVAGLVGNRGKIVKQIDKRIAQEIKNWPGIYQKRADVLHKWFCVNSNGWVAGAIASEPYDESPSPEQPLHKIDFSKSWTKNYTSIKHNLRCAKIKMVAENAELLALLPAWEQDGLDWIYPMFDDCNLVTFEEDIQPEYADAVRETIAMVFSVEPSEKYPHKEWQHNVKMAESALTKLQTYFGNNEGYSNYLEWDALKATREKDFQELLKTL